MSEIIELESNIGENDLLTNALLFEARWNPHVSVSGSLKELEEIIQALNEGTSQIQDEEARLDKVLDMLYCDFMFSSTCQQFPDSVLLSPSYALNFRTGEDLTLSIVLEQILKALSFSVEVVKYQESMHLKIALHQGEYYLVEPTSGLQERFIKMEDAEPLDEVEIEEQPNDKLIVTLLQSQKNAFIDEGFFAQALCCVDMLMQIAPDDPYERRDRGFLLQQLDCFKVACDDFEFFIEKCPKDPAAEFLKVQLDEMKRKSNVFH